MTLLRVFIPALAFLACACYRPPGPYTACVYSTQVDARWCPYGEPWSINCAGGDELFWNEHLYVRGNPEARKLLTVQRSWNIDPSSPTAGIGRVRTADVSPTPDLRLLEDFEKDLIESSLSEPHNIAREARSSPTIDPLASGKPSAPVYLRFQCDAVIERFEADGRVKLLLSLSPPADSQTHEMLLIVFESDDYLALYAKGFLHYGCEYSPTDYQPIYCDPLIVVGSGGPLEEVSLDGSAVIVPTLIATTLADRFRVWEIDR